MTKTVGPGCLGLLEKWLQQAHGFQPPFASLTNSEVQTKSSVIKRQAHGYRQQTPQLPSALTFYSFWKIIKKLKDHQKSSRCLRKKKKRILLLITYSKGFPVQLPIFLLNYLPARPFNACLRLCDFAIPEYILALWHSWESLQNISNLPALLTWTGLQEKVSPLSINSKHDSYNIQGKTLPKIDMKTLIVWIPWQW